MEIIIAVIIGIVALFIFITGKSGVGISNSLVQEIYYQYRQPNALSKHFPSISLNEAFEALKKYDSEPNPILDSESYSFNVLVSGEPCIISIKKEAFAKGVRLQVMKIAETNAILEKSGRRGFMVDRNSLKSI